MVEVKRKHKYRNLVYLVYARNDCYVVCTDRKPENVTVDAARGVWSVDHGQANSDKTEYQIGASRYDSIRRKFSGLVIAVYDRTKIEHLDHMVHATREATYDPRGSIDMG